MSIHSEIKRRRIALDWSHERLAAEVSALEKLTKPLAWQSVQQWEREDGTAPKRKRLHFVAAALGTSVEQLMTGLPDPDEGPAINAIESDPTDDSQLRQVVDVFVGAVAGLSSTGWAMVSGALEKVVGHPEMRDDTAANVLMVLQAPSAKRHIAA